MARIRNIKPEFFRHEGLQKLEVKFPKSRIMLTFSGLWTQCDKQGVFQYKPNQLHLDILPFIKFDMENTLSILIEEKYIFRFTADNDEYGYIPTFKKHQAISGKELGSKFRYPEPPQNILELAKDSPERTALVPDQFQDSSKPAPDLPDIMTSRHHDIMTTDISKREPQAATEQPSGEEESTKGKRRVFIPPTLEEVREYCSANHYNIDPEKFIKFYESSTPPWHDSKGNKVKNWKGKVITWASREPNTGLKVRTRTAVLEMEG